MRDIHIDGRTIGDGHSPFVIAEMSGNHNQSLDRALEIVDAAAEAGAHAIKLQTYTADTMTIDVDTGEFFIDDPDSLWHGETLYKLYQKAYTPWEWHAPLFERARRNGLIPFSTPFDETAVDFLQELDVACFKIASFENIDIPLLRKVAATGKPVIVSTGMATIAELDEMVRTIRGEGSDVVLLKCTSTYPATPESTNLRTIPHLRELFDCHVGLSDHTHGIGVSIASVALGARVIEKHFTLNRSDGGVDAAFSIEPAELKALVEESSRAELALGMVKYGPSSSKERQSKKHRRSLYVVKKVNEGEVLTPENVRVIRPGLGLAPKYLDVVLGQRVAKDIERGTPLSWELLKSGHP
jgi:pseudaminic acid synthase